MELTTTMPSNVEHYKGLKPAGKGLYKCNNLGPKALGYLGQPPPPSRNSHVSLGWEVYTKDLT